MTQRPTASALSRQDRRRIGTRALSVFFCGAALSACTMHLRETVPNAPAAITAATALCNWWPADHEGHMHAELSGDKWHVWDDRGGAEAILNRYDTPATYVCVTL